ncbi:S-adenosyl-L-methionine-dependent methyltransferase [Paramyrothecium foliicola]|nr:S-adenosyl-L-methionine-dependent methyltransferase [Paramyrothecium foliicola]
MSSFQPLPASAAKTIASYSLTEPSQAHIEISQAEHRIQLTNLWQIVPGSRVLEIGCGQGNCTAVLAEAVGPSGHVDAVDPGSPDYGAPFTLAQAQAHISASPVGNRVTWHCAEPVEFLAGHPESSWDYVVFSHCIWYFPSPDVLAQMLTQLRGRANKLLIAEYALAATERSAAPHVLAAIAIATLEAHNETSEANIRSLISPNVIKTMAGDAGWTLQHEDVVVPGEGLLDGHWESAAVKHESFLEDIETHVMDPKLKTILRSSRDAVINSLLSSGAKQARTMDVWVASLL